MALIPVLAGQQSASAPRGPNDVILDVVTGGIVSILENDTWEITRGPGYYVTAFPVPGTNLTVGYDDIFQGIVIPLGVALMPIPGSVSLAVGMFLGTVATKIGEQYGYKVQIIPHTTTAAVGTTTAAASFAASKSQHVAMAAMHDNDNQMRIHKMPLIPMAQRPGQRLLPV